MSHVFLEMTMTVDGFTAAVGVSLEHPFGLDGERVHSWMRDSVFTGAPPGDDDRDGVIDDTGEDVDRDAVAQLYESTGAFVLGRRTLDVREAVWGDEPVFQGRPCFVVTSRPHESYVRGGSRYEFVTGGVAEAIARASAAASAASVCVIGGADVARQALALGLVDEALLHIVPVLLGGGDRLFPDSAPNRVELEPVSAVQGARATHLRYRLPTVLG
ncbi:dihydrofolate reductase [Agromyces hippuratus]|uniref:Dihydrofolate reductase n=1 Tax=Agromyces hippuratus TaxID=286438 RepID=A0A852WVF2_9MICO|nr:dihydrofolate reductase family protein [Agromyces hippuratus]NYG21929.1 dihydrofolate reductase [Agromyces hippuratus]